MIHPALEAAGDHDLVLPACAVLGEDAADRLVALAAENGVKNSIILWPLRVAVSGKASTPGGATEICALLGKQESIDRVIRGIELLGK